MSNIQKQINEKNPISKAFRKKKLLRQLSECGGVIVMMGYTHMVVGAGGSITYVAFSGNSMVVYWR